MATLFTFPPTLPEKFSRFVEIEVVDANTFKLKNKSTKAEIGTMTRSQLEAAIQAAVSTSEG
jgi:hypothetical protein